MTDQNDQPLEKMIERLENVVERLESGEVTLEKSIQLYEEGRRLGNECLGRLSKLEERVQLVMKGQNGELQTEPFAGAQEEES